MSTSKPSLSGNFLEAELLGLDSGVWSIINEGGSSDTRNDSESQDYIDTLTEHLKSKLEEYGTVLELNDEGAKIDVNLQSFVDEHVSDEEWLFKTLDDCGETDYSCILGEIVESWDFEKPKWNFDDRYYPDVDKAVFNDVLVDRLSDFM